MPTPNTNTNNNNLPPDPMRGYEIASAALHEMYLSLIQAGFTQEQAMQVVCSIAAKE